MTTTQPVHIWLLLGMFFILAVASQPTRGEEDDPSLDSTIRRLQEQLLAEHRARTSASYGEDGDPAAGQVEERGGKARHRRLALSDRRRLWPGAIVPYAFYNDSTYGLFTPTHRSIMRRALRYIESTTCVTFKELPQQEVIDRPRGRLMIAGGTRGAACQSEIGMGVFKPFQVTYLTLGCLAEFGGNRITHELMHTLGFFHEHTRPDRDLHIKVNTKNIMPRGLRSFRIERFPSTDLDTEYDYESLQHYTDYQYLRSRLPYGSRTFTPLVNTSVRIGQRYAMSVMDVFRINRLYRCPAKHAPARELLCHGCISHLHITAVVHSSGGQAAPDALRLVMVVNDRGTYRTESHMLGIALNNSVHIWRVRPRSDCLRPASVQVLALRANSKEMTVVSGVSVLAKLGRVTRFMASLPRGSTKVTLSSTEEDAQRLLVPTPQPSCSVCRTACVRQIAVLFKFREAVLLERNIEMAVSLTLFRTRRWKLKRLTSVVDPIRAKVHQFVGNVSDCMTAESMEAMGIVQRRFVLPAAFPAGLEMSVITATLQGGRSTVLADHSFSPSAQRRRTSLILQFAQACMPGCIACR